MNEIRVIDGFSRTQAKMNGTNQGDRGQGFSRTNSDVNFNKQMAEPRGGGFSRVDVTGEPGAKVLDGFSRTESEILQGYQGADEQDLDEYAFLVQMEHDSVINGIQSLQGKKERKERKEARKEKKAEKKADKQEKKEMSAKQKGVRPKKAARKEKKAERQGRRTEKKNLKLAKKEEKVARKKMSREQKELDKIARRERKAARGGLIKDIVADLGDKAKGIFANMVSRPDQFDMSLSDMSMPESVREELMPVFDRWNEMAPEDVLDERAELLEDRSLEDAAENAAKPAADADKGSGFGSMLLPVVAIAAVAMGGKKKKGRKK